MIYNFYTFVYCILKQLPDINSDFWRFDHCFSMLKLFEFTTLEQHSSPVMLVTLYSRLLYPG